MEWIASFLGAKSGSAATILAVALPVMTVAAGAAMDYSNWANQKASLQAAADAAALGGTRELGLPGRTEIQVKAAASSIATSNLRNIHFGGTVTVASEVLNKDSVRVSVSAQGSGNFSRWLAIDPPMLVASATAASNSDKKLCILTTDESSSQAVYMKSNSRVTANDCMVQSNSLASQGIYTDSGITLSAKLICSSGGFYGAGKLVGLRLSDCPKIQDPLSARTAPSVTGGCTKTSHKVELNNNSSSRHVLNPGVYCGGLFIGGNSYVTLSPGIYIIKDGPLKFDSNADIVGKNVGFYFFGNKSVLDFTSNTKVNLDAPKTGDMAGILMFEDRQAPLGREHRITSNYASNMTGTIYFSRGTFVVDASNTVSEKSAYTVIISRKLLLSASPNLVLNANYGMTDVPVPPGVAETGRIRLIR